MWIQLGLLLGHSFLQYQQSPNRCSHRCFQDLILQPLLLLFDLFLHINHHAVRLAAGTIVIIFITPFIVSLGLATLLQFLAVA